MTEQVKVLSKACEWKLPGYKYKAKQVCVYIVICNQKTPDSAEEELFLYWIVLCQPVTS